MNILSPDLIWVNNSCYRLPFLKDTPSNDLADSSNLPLRQPAYVEDPEDLRPTSCVVDEQPLTECFIEELGSGKFQLRMPVPKVFWGKIIGMKGYVKKRIEQETGTTLSIPGPSQEGDITVKGTNRLNIHKARSSIQAIVHTHRQSLSYTHFLSISVVNPEITENFGIFKMKALELCPSLPAELFSPPGRLHLTLVMLCLLDNRERQSACAMLNNLADILREKIQGEKIKVDVCGIDIMNDDPSEARVVFAAVKNPLIQEIAHCASAHYYGTGYTKERDMRDNVKLHVTLMNTRYLQPPDEVKARAMSTFNAKPILENLKDFYFGQVDVNKIQISILGNHGPDDYYTSSAEIRI